MPIIKKHNLSDLILEKIIEGIQNGHFQPGEKLPSEAELSKLYGVGRHALREALRKLEQMAIIETVPGLGSFIKKEAPHSFSHQLSSLLVLNTIKGGELYDIRVALETYAAKLAAERITPDLTKDMQNQISIMEKAASEHNLQKFVEANVNFHEAIVTATQNTIFGMIYRTIRDLVIHAQQNTPVHSDSYKTSIHSHKQILQAILNRDAQTASDLVREHLDEVQNRNHVENNIQYLKEAK